MQLAPMHHRPAPPVELEAVPPQLLLPPHEPGGLQSTLTGGPFELGDRVACVRATGSPPFGLRGTVIGEHPKCWFLCCTAAFAH